MMALPPLTTRVRRQLAAGALPILLAAAYAFFVRPRDMAEIGELRARLERLRRGNGTAAASATRGSPELRAKLRAYESQIDVLQRLIPAGEEVPELLDAVSARAGNSGVELTLVRPEHAEPSRFYSRQRYTLSAIGSFDGIGRFLVAVGSLPRIASPVHLKVVPLADPAPATADGGRRLQAEFEVETFVAPAATGATSTDGEPESPLPASPADPPPASGGPPLEREVFTWPPATRDPFAPAARRDAAQGHDDDLLLIGIVYAGDTGSLAVLSGNGQTWRVREGQRAGKARVLEIRPSRVVVSVPAAAGSRLRVLELKRKGAR